MVALVTGASAGIGRDIARVLSKNGFDLVLVARREECLLELKNELHTQVDVFVADLSIESECHRLCEYASHRSFDIVVNNAGFGLFGPFTQTDLERELAMIDLNIRAVHILTKFFVKQFAEKNAGILLNVASSAAFFPGPYMATYYATKAYVLRLSQSVREELLQRKSKVQISVLCPGPVDTEFNGVANVRFGLKGLSSMSVATYAVDKMLRGKFVIVPGFTMKCARVCSKFLPEGFLARCTAHFQKKKSGT